MKKDELKKFTTSLIYEKPKVYKYLMNKAEKQIKNSVLYKKRCYCPRCKKIVLANESRYVSEPGIVNCFECGKSILVERISNRVKKERIIRFIFDILDYKDNCLINQTYCITHYYDFKSGYLKFKESFFKLSTEVYDLISNKNCFMNINVYQAHMGYKYIFPFKEAYAKNARYPFEEQNIYYHWKYEDVFFLRSLYMTTNIKNKFLKYFNLKQIEKDFYYNCKMIPFLRSLCIYPNLETLYKLEKYTWSDDVCDYFRSVVDCLKKGKGYLKYNYELFKDIYTSTGKKSLDFVYYRINLQLGKPYVKDNKLINYLSTHKAYIDHSIIKYLSKQPFYLYDDYLIMAKELNFDLNDNKILYPKKLKESHDDLVRILDEKKVEENKKQFKKLNEDYSLLEFEKAGFNFYLPTDVITFKTRGKQLAQCLFSAKYHERYLDKRCIIVYIDSKNSNSKDSKFTLELNQRLEIVQLHGFANDVNCSNKQKHNLEVVKGIIERRLELLKIVKGQVVYKNSIFHSSGKMESINI